MWVSDGVVVCVVGWYGLVCVVDVGLLLLMCRLVVVCLMCVVFLYGVVIVVFV